MHPSSGNYESRRELPCEGREESASIPRTARRVLSALLCLVAVFAAGCHSNNQTSGYGVAWVTLTDQPGDFTSYIVNVDSITLTRSDGIVVTALATVETVDFTKLNNIAELWGTATIPIGTYVSASIVLDYTNANIAVIVNGLPQQATVVTPAGAAVTTQTINVIFDPANQLVVPPTYATTSAQRLAIDFNLAASSSVNLATSPATVTVKPYLTVGIAPADNKPIRVRGPLINSSVPEGTYTVYIRPFHDEIDSLGSLSLFTDANTTYTVNGVVLTGTPGLTQLSQSSTGTTVTAAYTTYQPTATPNATAGIFHAFAVVAGSTLEDVYTQGLEGDVVARNGNTLTLLGSTLALNSGVISYNEALSTVIVGPGTTVTADDTALTGFNYNSIAVGQHIIARGIYSLPNNVVTLDATGTSATNTGSVRLISTQLWGSLLSAGAGNVLLNLQTINNWPVTDFSFAGNGTSTAANPVASSFSVNTGVLAIPDTTVGDPLWIDGSFAPFGGAPPDFAATSVNSELSVQMAGAGPTVTVSNPTPLSCGQGNLDCVPASMQVVWVGTGTSAPYSAISATGMTIDLSNPALVSALIRIGPESINMLSLPASPPIVATAPTAGVPTSAGTSGSTTVIVPPVFLPEYSFGDPLAVAPAGINVYSVFATFGSQLTSTLATKPALQLEARGTYNRAANTFTAISVNVVL